MLDRIVEQMKEIGIADAYMDEHGYVYGTIPATGSGPVIGLIAHMDTSFDACGADIKARITEPYAGGDILLNERTATAACRDIPHSRFHLRDGQRSGNRCFRRNRISQAVELGLCDRYFFGHLSHLAVVTTTRDTHSPMPPKAPG